MSVEVQGEAQQAAALRQRAREALTAGDVASARSAAVAAQRLFATEAGAHLEQVCACYAGFSQGR